MFGRFTRIGGILSGCHRFRPPCPRFRPPCPRFRPRSSTIGWDCYGRFETMYQAKHYTLKYPKKQWKIITAIQMDNIILPDDQMTKTQQDEVFDSQESLSNCIGTA